MRALSFSAPIHRTRRGRQAAAVLGALLAVAIAAPAASAAPSVTVIASGLDNPRGITLSPTGSIYVAEAGRGGDVVCVPGPEGGDLCLGESGAITRVFHRGGFNRVVTGLPSGASPDGSAATGPHDVAFDDQGRLFAVIGLGADPAVRASLPDFAGIAGYFLRIQRPSGSWKPLADIAGFEAEENPDGGLPDSNPYGLLAGSGGFAVVDAGANALLWINDDRSIQTLAVFPDQTVDTAEGPVTVQAVPTTVTRVGDWYYVGELTGFPFVPGAANIWRVPVGGGTPEVFATGFTHIIDIAPGPDGSLYVLEIAHNGLASGDPTGALLRVAADGTSEVLLTEPLFMPGGLAVRDDGTIYITNCGVCPGGGEVLRVNL
jgi:hypothetical protein